MVIEILFRNLIKLTAKMQNKALTDEALQVFDDRLQMMRINQLKEKWPELWEDFKERYNVVKEQLNDGDEPEVLLSQVYPGGITHYPETFEYFRLRLYEQPELFPAASVLDTPVPDFVVTEPPYNAPNEPPDDFIESAIGFLFNLLQN
ncbi:hypothetical protein KG088_17775 [Halomonas sp. TRM85114]|uniref:hypothetical protein n=1 Tax=Halomonas jincaotanensis TaxID=2810616 RepID=UPI001BD35DFD|nr:hypothetical protein [Halomonas jincaotanensis]MBS9405457.1 hypothetical protein [Halomonas jincaotanensis]